MKFTTAFSLLAIAASTVGAVRHTETNASRMARGLGPAAPARRWSSTSTAKRNTPSGTPSGGNCNVGTMQCCNSVTHANDGVASLLTGVLGLVVGADTAIGITCSPLSVVGLGGNKCNAQPVCCENNNFNGLIAVGCSPIIINA